MKQMSLRCTRKTSNLKSNQNVREILEIAKKAKVPF